MKPKVDLDHDLFDHVQFLWKSSPKTRPHLKNLDGHKQALAKVVEMQLSVPDRFQADLSNYLEPIQCYGWVSDRDYDEAIDLIYSRLVPLVAMGRVVWDEAPLSNSTLYDALGQHLLIYKYEEAVFGRDFLGEFRSLKYRVTQLSLISLAKSHGVKLSIPQARKFFAKLRG